MSSNMTKFKQSAYKGVIKKKLRLQDEVWTDMADALIKRKKTDFLSYPIMWIPSEKRVLWNLGKPTITKTILSNHLGIPALRTLLLKPYFVIFGYGSLIYTD